MSSPAQLALPVRLRDHATFDSFEPGEHAGLVAELRAQATQPEGRQPAWLWGQAGSGRSHLLQALCVAATEAGHRAAYLPLASLVMLGPGVLAGQEGARVVCLDDLDQVAMDRDWALAIIGLYHAAREAGAWLVAVTRPGPGEFRSALADLDSRLAGSAVHRLLPLDEAGMLRALPARARRLGLELPEETSRWLLHRLPRDPAGLFSALDRLDAAALQAQRRLTVPFVREVLAAETCAASPPAPPESPGS